MDQSNHENIYCLAEGTWVLKQVKKKNSQNISLITTLKHFKKQDNTKKEKQKYYNKT